MKGTVTFYSDYRGYGFIVGADKREYFVHVSQFNFDGHKTLEKGQQVSFKPIQTRRGAQATNVTLLEAAEAESEQQIAISLKKNPFTPQHPIIEAQKFAGRRESLINAIDALFNNKNILILGPRGIGKSSLSYQLMYLAQGQQELLRKTGINLGKFKFNYLAGDHRCLAGNNLADICNGLITTFCQRINNNIEDTTSKINIGVDIKLFKFSSETQTKQIVPSDISLKFVTKIDEIISKYPIKRSIVFLIDEIDVLDPDIDLASFLKVTSEKFVSDQKCNVSFIVSGVTGVITSLISHHQSVSRLFENLSLPKMQNYEIEEIIDNALNGTGVTITQEAKNEIISLSNQFPQPVHLLGYHSFKIDNDDKISIDDLYAAKNFIVSDIKRQDFESKFEGIGAGAMTELIRVVAQAPLDTVNLNYLKANLRHMSEERILGTLGGLQERGIIEKQHRGIYRFHDPLFKIYLRWLFGIEEL